MLESSQQEVKTLEESSEIQRDTYMIEIENLRKHIEILNHEYKEECEKEALAFSNYDDNSKNYETTILCLKDKINKIYKLKEQ